MWRFLSFVFFTMVWLSQSAVAGSGLRLNMDLRELASFHARILKDLEVGGLKDLSIRERETILRLNGTIRKLTYGKTDISKLNDDDSLMLFNAHEHIVAILNDTEESRLICERRKSLGSNLKNLECLTYREREEIMVQSKRNIDQLTAGKIQTR